ncbi:uncharacterized protein [Euphorbia lathyris]|uniref:uncharacterized protein n=1 Tax=Euphorbia lathyris TaxID=212925 RepID=UPI0033132007
MIKTLNPYSNTARTAEIMSRYRPIAPKPVNPDAAAAVDNNPSNITHSPYLWQTRSTRTRKRGRAAVSPPTIKRTRTHHILALSSSTHLIYSPRLSFQAFPQGLPLPNVNPTFENPLTTTSHSDLVTLPLLPTVPEISSQPKMLIDLNTVAEIPEENKDLLIQPPAPTTNVIAPQPIRPVGSSIRVGCISEDPIPTPPAVHVLKKPEEVEREVESETFPAVISDSSYRVRLANSAYKEMVGQPECSWLDSIVTGKRICGEVILHLADSEVPTSSDKFFCWVNIEWGHQGEKKTVHAFCDVIRLSCQSKDYLFSWRFHTRGSSQSSSSNA